MFCTQCGNKIEDTARFCDQCGAAVSPVEPTEMYNASAPAEVTAPVAEPPKKKRKKVWPWLCLLLVIVAAAVVAILLFGKKTVYLMTESKVENADGSVTITRYTYSEDGLITNYEYEVDYPSSMEYATDFHVEIAYKYDENGQLIATEFESNNLELEATYTYEDGVISEIELDGAEDLGEDIELEFECSSDGQPESIELIADQGETLCAWEFKYHDNGSVKKISWVDHDTGSERETRYDENGNCTESIFRYDGEILTRTVMEYNERNYVTRQEQYGRNDAPVSAWEFDYQYEEEMLVGLEWIMEIFNGEESHKVELIFECEWDDLECTLSIDKIKGDDAILKDMPSEIEDLEIVLKFDEAHHLLELEAEAGENEISQSYTYEEFKVARDYEKIHHQTNPLYLYFLLNIR